MQGGEMVSSSVRTIRQYCSVCKATLDMAVVDTVQAHEVTWLKCPRCNGILPHMMSGEEEASSTPTAEQVPAAAEESESDFNEAERSQAVDYEAGGEYEVGQIIYHRSINSYGRVTTKEALPGNRGIIKVQFEDGQEMTLRERA